MKIEIDYFVNKGSTDLPCGARTEYQGQSFHGIAKTWEEAEFKVITNVTQFIETKVPPRKTVEIHEPPELDPELDIPSELPF